MSDAVTTARSARESLARALNALQSDPNVPPHLLELAEPVAQAMGALHQIERTGALVPHADVALNNVRAALGKLQAQPTSHPAILGAMEAVAGSLGLVHALARMAQAPAPQPQASPFAQTALAPSVPQQPQQPAFPQPASFPQQQPQSFQQPASFQQQQQPSTAFQRPSQDAFSSGPFQPGPPPAQMQQQQFAPQPQFAPQVQRSADPFASPGTVPIGDVQLVNADLGAHSPSNFYKGLAGNDIIDHGGLFVSTYKIPKIGSPVRLKVSLPGGYEFEANAIVRWSREPRDGSSDAPPGFGAQFTEITPEARQLVYRYVRNREPLFHDDL